MPLPLAPVASIALRYGAVALAAYTVSRSVSAGRRDQRAEDAMDDVEEGLTLRRDGEQTNATARFRRVVRLGDNGPGVELDISTLGRIRLRKV